MRLLNGLLGLLLVVCNADNGVVAMSKGQLASLRDETEHMFYHGFTNYMKYAFPEDELRPLNCSPLTRDAANPGNKGHNDPLGNYSLTLVDSLSTLAILASGTASDKSRKQALHHFQSGVISLVKLYGDGSGGDGRCGERSCGFDLDSRVQVFETVIRGVGGLLSAHLFAEGDLPMTGYNVSRLRTFDGGIKWSQRFTYNGQLLRLALDLAERLLPAFSTATGIPYPRVNLRHGISFYENSPESCGAYDGGQCEDSQCAAVPPADREETETNTAGAGTLMLEFIVLSRLTGDSIFEHVAKRAFWSLWDRRSAIGLVGSNIDAETGFWTNSYTGLGAGVDSFYEYALKTYVLLSGTDPPAENFTVEDFLIDFYPPPLRPEHHDPASFLKVWRKSQRTIKHHLYRGKAYTYPHFVQGDLFTGAAKALWMDALSAFYPGLLTLAGDLNGAIENHILFTALWTRYSAMPERWSVATAGIEHGLGWWLGRPEFIESNYHIYRATQDPWYLHVGEMTLRDMKRLCWVSCGLSGLQDVRTAEKNNRMESFFLGETAKYLFLLFDEEHPFNKLDGPFVFSTEGHPLLIPGRVRRGHGGNPGRSKTPRKISFKSKKHFCPKMPVSLPFSVSNTAARRDLFHAAHLVRLDLKPSGRHASTDRPSGEDPPRIESKHGRPDSHYFPWTLPPSLVPFNGTSSVPVLKPGFDITFPSFSNLLFPMNSMQRVQNGIMINNMGGIRLGMIQDVPGFLRNEVHDLYRVHAVNNIPLGRDEKIFLAKETLSRVVDPSDPLFTRVQDNVMLDLAVDIRSSKSHRNKLSPFAKPDSPTLRSLPVETELVDLLADEIDPSYANRGGHSNALRTFAQRMSSVLRENGNLAQPQHQQQLQQEKRSSSMKWTLHRHWIPAITAEGDGAASLPNVPEALGPDARGSPQGSLIWTKIFVAGHNCGSSAPLPSRVPNDYQVLVFRRGECSFTEKLANIPSFVPSETSLQLVIVVSFGGEDGDDEDEAKLARPLIEKQYVHTGVWRRFPIPMLMVGGGKPVYDSFKTAAAVGFKRRYSVEAQGIPISNLVIT